MITKRRNFRGWVMAAWLVNVLGMLGLASRMPAHQKRGEKWQSNAPRSAERVGASSHVPNADGSPASPGAWTRWAEAATPNETPPGNRKALMAAAATVVLVGVFLAGPSDPGGGINTRDQRVGGAEQQRLEAVEAELNEMQRQQRQAELEWERQQQQADQEQRMIEQRRLQCERELAQAYALGNYNVAPMSCR